MSKFYKACFGRDAYNDYYGQKGKAEVAKAEMERARERAQQEFKDMSDAMAAIMYRQQETMLSDSVPELQEQVRSLQQRIIELEGDVTYEEV